MKNFKLILPAFIILMGLGILFSQSAFKSSDKKTSTLKYRYIGTDALGLQDPLNWEDVSNEATPDACETGTELPCLVVFEDNEYDNIADFYDQHETAPSMFGTGKVINKKD